MIVGDRVAKMKLVEQLTLVTFQTAHHGSTSPRFASPQPNHASRPVSTDFYNKICQEATFRLCASRVCFPVTDACAVEPTSDYGSDLPCFATAASASTTGSLKVQRGTVRIRSRSAKTREVAAASGASSRKAASNSRPNPRKLSTLSSHR